MFYSVFGKTQTHKTRLMALGYAVRCDAHVPEDITTRVRVYKALQHWYMSVTGSTGRLVNVNSVSRVENKAARWQNSR